MWRLSIVPTEGAGLTGADVVVHAEPGARVVDLAGVLAEHLGGGAAAAPPLLVPVVDGDVAAPPAVRLRCARSTCSR